MKNNNTNNYMYILGRYLIITWSYSVADVGEYVVTGGREPCGGCPGVIQHQVSQERRWPE